MIWREKRLLLALLAVILLANVFFFFTYRVQYQNRLDALNDRLDSAQGQFREARSARTAAEATLQGFRSVEKDVEVVFDEHWSTEGARLTELIAEIKRLAVASSLEPKSYTFDRSESGEDRRSRNGGVGAVEVGVSFSVGGTYEQARRLINLLELSQQFVIIDRISLRAAEGNLLSLDLHIKTLFREPAKQPAANKRS